MPSCTMRRRQSANDFDHQLISVETAFHQRVSLTRAHQCNGLPRCRMAVWYVDNAQPVEIEMERGRECANVGFGSDHGRDDEVCSSRLDGPSKRRLVAGMSLSTATTASHAGSCQASGGGRFRGVLSPIPST